MSFNFQNSNIHNNNNVIESKENKTKKPNVKTFQNKRTNKNNINDVNENEKKMNEKYGGKNKNQKSESEDFNFENIDLDEYFGSQIRGNSQSIKQTSKKSYNRNILNKLLISKNYFSIPSSSNILSSKNNNHLNNNNYNVLTSKNGYEKFLS